MLLKYTENNFAKKTSWCPFAGTVRTFQALAYNEVYFQDKKFILKSIIEILDAPKRRGHAW